jgi:monovalent cation/hydrogen antiporter
VEPVELVVGLLVILVALVALALSLRIPYPIVLVLGGLLLTLPPRLPTVQLEPDIVFLVFLPPLLFSDAVNSSWREFRENWRPISLLSIGLVFTTTAAVLLVAHYFLGVAWGPAFVLGAVLGPTDTVAVATVLERFRIPRRLLAILRGESLVNDASALVLFETAVHTTQRKAYIWGSILGQFAWALAGGITVGLIVGWLIVEIRRHTREPLLANTISLLAAFAAYLPAAAIQASGVLAVVTAALYLSWYDPRISTARSRLQASGTWEMLTFLLNGLLFILIGLQLRTIGRGMFAEHSSFIIAGCILVSLTVICVRIAWVFGSTYLPRLFQSRRDSSPSFSSRQQAVLISWAGIRGGISLAAALAIPPTLPNGFPFPQRTEILIFTFAVILATLVVQGLSLPRILSWLHFRDDIEVKEEQGKAWKAMAAVALDYLESLDQSNESRQQAIAHLNEVYQSQSPAIEATRGAGDPIGTYLLELISLELNIVKKQRGILIRLRDAGEISDEMLRRFQADLDLKESQLSRRDFSESE